MPRQITVDDLARMLAAAVPVTLVDVRQPWEHDAARLPASILLPLPELDERWIELRSRSAASPEMSSEVLPEVLPEVLIVTYCHHGIRSLGAAALLENKGIGPVASLAGGIDAWSRYIDPTIPRY